MPVLTFRLKPPPDPRTFRVVLRKGARRRLYEIRSAGAPGLMQTWVRFDGKAHRALLTRSAVQLQQIRAEYAREIAELEQDGWVRSSE